MENLQQQANRQIEALGALSGISQLVCRLQKKGLPLEVCNLIENEACALKDELKLREYSDVFASVRGVVTNPATRAAMGARL